MTADFAQKESLYMTEISKKTNLVGLYKQENAAKELRIKDLEKQVGRLKEGKRAERGKVHKEVQTEGEPRRSELAMEISIEKPEEVKSTLLANFPKEEFGKMEELQNVGNSGTYDMNLEKSSARLEVISKQEKILLDLNKHLNEDSNVFLENLPEETKNADLNKVSNLQENSFQPSFDLGLSLKKFSNKLLNVIELNNEVLKVELIRVRQCRTGREGKRPSSRTWRS